MSRVRAPEVGDVIQIARPTEAQLAQADESSAPYIDVDSVFVEIVEVKEPGFYVAREPVNDLAAYAYAHITSASVDGRMLKSTEYEADAWVQLKGDSPRRTRIGRLFKRQPEPVRVKFGLRRPTTEEGE